jgi:hypothetical protein
MPWIDTEEARSDFILAAAVVIFGPLLYFFTIQILPFLRTGVLGGLLGAAFLFAISGLVPLLLSRYRDEGAAAFGIDTDASAGVRAGILIALPAVALGLVELFARHGTDPWILAGELRQVLLGPFEALIVLVGLAAIFLGGLLLYTFLPTKAYHGFAQNEIPQLEALRTFGLGAAGASVVIGLFVAIGGRVTLTRALIDALALAVMVLLADRLVTPGAMTSRAAVLGPAIIALIVRIELFGPRGFFASLRQALLAAGVVIVIAVLVRTGRYAWAALPILLAIALYPSPLSPFPYLVFG